MRILELKVNDLKRIEAIDIKPTGNVVEIAGKNGQGKTSLLDGIFWALAGTKNITREPVRKGADKAKIEVDLGEFIVTRRIKPDGSGSVTVANKEGMTAKSPQQMLDKLVGELTFDPLLFIKKSAAEQLDMLRSFAPDVDFKALDRAETEAVVTRRDLNRDVKDLTTLVNSTKAPELPAEIDVSELTAKLGEARDHNAQHRAAVTERNDHRTAAATARNKVTDLNERRNRILADADRLMSEIKTLEVEAAVAEENAAEPIDIEPIDEAELARQLQDASTKNAERAKLVGQAEAIEKNRTRLADKEKLAEAAEKLVTDIRAKRETALKAINLPIEGLTIGADGIVFNGHPLEQASDAEQLRVGIALAMKANPKLRVIRIRDGSLLDDDSMSMLDEMAEQNDFQVWIERVGQGSADAIVIEAGRVKGAAVTVAPVEAAPSSSEG